jgi:hypothetical protein
MSPQTQEFVNIPGKQYGDCMRACIASLMDMPICLVPHFLRDAGGDAPDFWNRIYDFVEEHGWDFYPSQPAYLSRHATQMDGYHIIGGPSPRGNDLLHAVVGRHGKIVFDPHPSRAGLAGDPSEWTFDYLVKA